MAVTTEILRTYRAPRAVLRGLLALGQREDRAVAYLLAACGLIFIGQLPRLSREAFLDPEGPSFEARTMGALFAWLIVAPLLAYALAALSHLVARLLGGRGTWYGARLALFWSLLAVAPLMLLHGLVAGFIGPGVELSLVGGAVALAFCALWVISLGEAEQPEPS